MQRLLLKLSRVLTLVGTAALIAAPTGAQQRQLPPHTFLFGSWIGGSFPAPPNLPAALCLARPSVIFTGDVVMRSVLSETTYVQRMVSTVEAIPNGVDFRFLPIQGKAEAFSLAGDSNGFGCPNPDTLRVERRGENQIVFPNCAEFPYPLYRCGRH